MMAELSILRMKVPTTQYLRGTSNEHYVNVIIVGTYTLLGIFYLSLRIVMIIPLSYGQNVTETHTTCV